MRTNCTTLLVSLLLLPCLWGQAKLQNPGPDGNWEHWAGARIDSFLTIQESLGFSGAIIVAHGDRVVLRKGYGHADREKRVAYTPETIQSNGSNTKQFTAAAILLLESRGQLSVTDRLAHHFEEVPMDKRDITIHQLLTHSSGLILGVGADEDPTGFGAFYKRLMDQPLVFPPGTGYEYSNAGYSLLGRIVEQVSGVGYETFLRENLLKPIGILDTGYVLPDWNTDRMAIGYRKGKKWGIINQKGWLADGPNWNLRANGGLFTNVDDMFKWLGQIRGKGVLGEEAIGKWTTGYNMESNGYSKYGYGLVTYEHPKWGRIVTHNGSNGVFASEFFWLPDSDFFFYIHGNNSLFPAYSFEGQILKAAFDDNFDIPRSVDFNSDVDPLEVRERQGVYQSQQGSISLMADDIRLIGKLHGQKTLDLMFGHDRSEIRQFAELTRITEHVMEKLEDGDADAFKGFVGKDVDARAFTRPFHERIARIGNLKSLHVIGTFKNMEGSRLYGFGPYTTFVHAAFEHWNQYWNLVWNEDGTYRGNYSGPWPELVLVPGEGAGFNAVRNQYPWNAIHVGFKDDCLWIGNERFCPATERQ